MRDKTEIDGIDLKILGMLQVDSKRATKEMASALNMSTTPIYERIKRLEREGYIRGYTAVVDNKRLGLGLVAFCSISLEKHNKEYLKKFEQDVRSLTEVKECYHIAGMFDYLLKIYVSDMSAYQGFITEKLSTIPYIGKVQSSFIMTEIKNDHLLEAKEY